MNRSAKTLIAGAVALAVAGAGGAGWYVWVRPHDRLALARSLMSKGDARGAQLALRSAVMADPSNAEAHFRLGEVWLRLGDPVGAERELTLALQRGWDAHAIAPQLARALVDQRRFADTLARTSTDGLTAGQAARVLVARSTAHLGLGQIAQARDAAARAEKLDPSLSEAALAAAVAAQAAGDGNAAEQAVGRALALQPHDPAALLLQADLLRARGDLKGALASLDTAVAASPSLPALRLARAQVLIGLHDDTRARADLAELLKVSPNNPLANFLNAQVLVRAGDFQGADRALQQAGPALARVPRGEMLLAVVKAKLGQPEQAIDAAQSYVGHAPTDPAGYKLLATLELKTKRPTDAAAVLQSAAAAGHADAETFDLLGQAEALSGQPQAALQAMQRAAALAPHDPGILARLASLRLGTGDASSAARDLQHLLDTQPPEAVSGSLGAQAAAELVEAALQAGHPEQASAALHRLEQAGAPKAQIDLLSGLVKLAKLDFTGARAAFAAVPDDAPQARVARSNLAAALVLQGHEKQAEAVLRAMLARDPADPAALAALQRLLLGAGRKDALPPVLEAAHRAAADNTQVTAALADAYVAAGQPAKALALLDPIKVSSPLTASDLAVLAARARAQMAQGMRAQAADTLRQILASQPKNTLLRRQVADVLLAAGDGAGAQAVISDGLAIQPGDPSLLEADVLAASKAGGLQAGLDRAEALARDPANMPTARRLRGDVYLAAGRNVEAQAAYAAVLDTPDAPSGAAVGAARAALGAGKPDQAADILRHWRANHPDDIAASSLLAVLDIGAGKLDEARSTLQAVLAKQPNDAEALNNLALVEQQQGNMQQARDLARRSWLLAATPQAADTLGWILLDGDQAAQHGAQSAALDLLRVAAQALPKDSTVQYHYAVALKDAGEHEAAAAILRRLVPPAAPFTEQTQARKLLGTLAPG